MAIPPFREDGWLPSGHYAASWDEIVNRFYGVPGSRRAFLTAQLLVLRDTLHELGLRGYLVLDGSYISAKPSRMISLLSTLWDVSKDGMTKGVIRVEL